MSTLYHPQCRFGSEGQKCLSVLRLWKDMKKEGCSCCWEIETLLYITTSGDLSALQLTTTTTPTTIPVSVSVSLSLSRFHFDFAQGPFPFLFYCYISHHTPFLYSYNASIHVLVWLVVLVFVYVCTHLSTWLNLLHSDPLLHPCLFWLPGCTCLVFQVRFSPSECTYNSLPLFVCLLYLSVSFICLLPSCCPSPIQPSWPFFSYSWNHIPWSGFYLQTLSFTQPECQIISVSVIFFSQHNCYSGTLILALPLFQISSLFSFVQSVSKSLHEAKVNHWCPD